MLEAGEVTIQRANGTLAIVCLDAATWSETRGGQTCRGVASYWAPKEIVRAGVLSGDQLAIDATDMAKRILGGVFVRHGPASTETEGVWFGFTKTAEEHQKREAAMNAAGKRRRKANGES